MTDILSFDQLDLPEPLQAALKKLGYETPTPVQQQSIPALLTGGDLLAQAQTGTGKTAAFALPILAMIDVNLMAPQAIVITPTRELAIQVAEAFQSYASELRGFHVAPIYGGQDYKIQLRALKRGSHVIVGTPGRVMDHLRRGSLTTESLKTLVLDEADEMLRMGFVSDIEWILEQIPQKHQTALFSATMPAQIQKISKRYLTDASKINIAPQEKTVDSIAQFYTNVPKHQKLDYLTRFLEVEDIAAAIIFVRTKNCAAELGEKLQARGCSVAALHGDLNQAHRKRVIDQLKGGSLDIIVATDVAARGINVERISHVINYDIPYDTESYIHRIGRTGRAGREGKALLFVSPREQGMLRNIERAINQSIKQLAPPSHQEMEALRHQQLKEKIVNILVKSKKLEPYKALVEAITAEASATTETDLTAVDVAAAVIYLMEQGRTQPPKEEPRVEHDRYESREPRRDRGFRPPSGHRKGRSNSEGRRERPGHRSDGDSWSRDDSRPKRAGRPGGDSWSKDDSRPKRAGRPGGDSWSKDDSRPKRAGRPGGDSWSKDDSRPKRAGRPGGDSWSKDDSRPKRAGRPGGDSWSKDDSRPKRAGRPGGDSWSKDDSRPKRAGRPGGDSWSKDDSRPKRAGRPGGDSWSKDDSRPKRAGHRSEGDSSWSRDDSRPKRGGSAKGNTWMSDDSRAKRPGKPGKSAGKSSSWSSSSARPKSAGRPGAGKSVVKANKRRSNAKSVS